MGTVGSKCKAVHKEGSGSKDNNVRGIANDNLRNRTNSKQ